MPTQISSQKINCTTNPPLAIVQANRSSRYGELNLGYCVDDPLDVFEKICKTHNVFQYGIGVVDQYPPINTLFLPAFYRPTNRSDLKTIRDKLDGLIIRETEAPRGTKIVSKLEELDLSICRAFSDSHRATKKQILQVLQRGIDTNLRDEKSFNKRKPIMTELIKRALGQEHPMALKFDALDYSSFYGPRGIYNQAPIFYDIFKGVPIEC